MHRSKQFSTVLLFSFLTITALTTFPQLTGQNKAVAHENNDKSTVPNSVEKKCTDKDVLALYKAVNELNIRVSVGINYIDFSRYYTDLVTGLNSLETAKNCPDILRQFDTVRENYNIARLLWQRSFRQQFIPVDHFIVKDALSYQPSLTRYDNSVATDDLVQVYLTLATEEFKKIEF